MEEMIVTIDPSQVEQHRSEWIAALEAGKVLYVPRFSFQLQADEQGLLRPDLRDPKKRNISLSANGALAGVAGDAAVQRQVAAMIQRFRDEAEATIAAIVPRYSEHLQRGATSYRPNEVESRQQSWRADDKRLHVDAFPSRPNYGRRLLRVFVNVNPTGVPRVWRVGEPFPDVARRFMPRFKPYSHWQAKALELLHVTKSFRSEYDHLMLQMHDAMKADLDYQQNAPQERVEFPPGSAWICFSDQASHAAMSGQYMLEHTMTLEPEFQYDVQSSPLAILSRMTGRTLV
jgi:hypothetical protein